ncbi:hypothetical protein KKD70_02555 [Patescibacteria group bacterium]|nr:hypothetical protein [Patescibacteria group bacterium]
MIFNSYNYSPKAFIDYIIEKMNLNNETLEVENKIRHEIEKKLGNRIIETIINAMDEDQMELYEDIKETYPERSQFEILFMLLDDIPMLHEFMIKSVNDLADEILYDVAKLDRAIDENTKVKNN